MITEYQYYQVLTERDEALAKAESLTAEVDRLSVFEMNADMLLSEQATIEANYIAMNKQAVRIKELQAKVEELEDEIRYRDGMKALENQIKPQENE